jgi:predicted  nucleic acid-binding Zn-ribbon protein
MSVVPLDGLIGLLDKLESTSKAVFAVLNVNNKLQEWDRTIQALEHTLNHIEREISRMSEESDRRTLQESVTTLNNRSVEMRTLYNEIRGKGIGVSVPLCRRNKAYKKRKKDFKTLVNGVENEIRSLRDKIWRLRRPSIVQNGVVRG